MAKESVQWCGDTARCSPFPEKNWGHTIPPVSQYSVNSIIDDETGESLEYRYLIIFHKHKKIWVKHFSNYLVHMAQGVWYRVKVMDTNFSCIWKTPTGMRKDVTYGQIVCNCRPQKDKPQQTRLVGGGNLTSLPGDASTRTEDIIAVKLLFNSTIYTKVPRFLYCDIKNIYLGTPMDRYLYIRLSLKWILD